MTRYSLAFLPSALKEWDKLGHTVREQFKIKLAERLETPRIDAPRLSGMADCYTIKLRAAGYRLVYRVDDGVLTIVVVAVGRRDRHARLQARGRAAARLTSRRWRGTAPASAPSPGRRSARDNPCAGPS